MPWVYFIVFRLGDSELHEDSDDEDDKLYYFMIMAVRRAGLESITGVALLSSVLSGIGISI